MRKTPKSQSRLNVEMLESRLTPAGNLDAFVQDGTLFLHADRQSHNIYVNVYDDRIVVRAVDSTSINGERNMHGSTIATFMGDENTITAIVYEGERGNDLLSLNSSFLTAERDLDITARTYAAGDRVSVLGGMISGMISIDTGAGYDSVTISGSYPSVILGVELGGGNDTMRITGDVGTIDAINADGGKDSLEIPATLYAAYSNVITGFEAIKLT